MRALVTLVAVLLCAAPLGAQNPTVVAVQRGKSCGRTAPREASAGPPIRYCEYHVGESLRFRISWIGGSATIDVVRASEAESGYSFAYETGLGCIVIQPGFARLKAAVQAGQSAVTAYVSPKTGGVFGSEAECQSAFSREPSNDR